MSLSAKFWIAGYWSRDKIWLIFLESSKNLSSPMDEGKHLLQRGNTFIRHEPEFNNVIGGTDQSGLHLDNKNAIHLNSF